MNTESLLPSVKQLLAESEYQKVLNLLDRNREKASSQYYTYIQEYCHKKLGIFNVDSSNCIDKLDAEFELNEEKHLIKSNSNIVLFIGRFRSVTGYGKATRDFFSALYEYKPLNYKVVGVDSQNLNLLGDTDSVKSIINGEKNRIEIVPIDTSSIIHVIYHELCDSFNRVLPSGKSTYSAWTIHEHPSMIFGKDKLLGLPQHIL